MRAAAIDAWGEEPSARELDDPPVGEDALPLDRVGEALARSRSGRTRGKLVLTP